MFLVTDEGTLLNLDSGLEITFEEIGHGSKPCITAVLPSGEDRVLFATDSKEERDNCFQRLAEVLEAQSLAEMAGMFDARWALPPAGSIDPEFEPADSAIVVHAVPGTPLGDELGLSKGGA